MRVILFNLVPYRQARSQREKYIFWGQAGVVTLLSVLFCYLINDELDRRLMIKNDLLIQMETVQSQIANQASRAEALKWEKDDLEQRIAILESVDKKSQRQSQLFALLDEGRPKMASLSTLSLEKQRVDITGVTANLPQLSYWVSDLKTNEGFVNQVNIVEVMAVKPEQTYKQDAGEDDKDVMKLVHSNLHDFRLTLDLVPVYEPPVKQESKNEH